MSRTGKIIIKSKKVPISYTTFQYNGKTLLKEMPIKIYSKLNLYASEEIERVDFENILNSLNSADRETTIEKLENIKTSLDEQLIKNHNFPKYFNLLDKTLSIIYMESGLL